MHAIQVIDNTHLIPLPAGGAVMVGAPPEALKLLLLWEYPSPSAVVLPPDPLYADRINQASFEFLLFNYLFVRSGLAEGKAFEIVCDPEQAERVTTLVRHILRGPSASEMTLCGTPARQRDQLLREMAAVSGPSADIPLERLARVTPFRNGCAELKCGAIVERRADGSVSVSQLGESVNVPRRAQSRSALPLYFADVEDPLSGPRFGLQVIGSASGFAAAEWSSCFIVWINGLPLIIDGTPYMDDHLRRLGIEDDHILGYLITHNHEDHANLVGQLVNRRPVTVLTSGPVMASLVARLASILDCPAREVRKLIKWIPLQPGMEDFGPALNWFGAEIRTWYSVHTVPTIGVDIALCGKRIRLPGDTLWGRQLIPLEERGVISPARRNLVQRSYDGADVIVADAGGGPIHPDPEEVRELLGRLNGARVLVTHIPESARSYLPTAEPGSYVELAPRQERSPEEATGLFGSPLFRGIPERWLLALLYGGEVLLPGEGDVPATDGALILLSGAMTLSSGADTLFPLQRGDLYHASLLPDHQELRLVSTARWTRILQVPEPLYRAFIEDNRLQDTLLRLYRTRNWWAGIAGEELGLDTLAALSLLCRERVFQPGEPVVRQGEAAKHFYVVVRGHVDVIRESDAGERRVGGFGAGYHFGEIALLAEETRTATVRATEVTCVLELPSRAFRRHLMNIPVARYRICSAAARRKAELLHPRHA